MAAWLRHGARGTLRARPQRLTSPLSLPCPAGDLRSEAGRAHVDACHALYRTALQQLYDEHKDTYAPNRMRNMRFVE